MSIPTYVKGFPQDGSTLGNTKTQIRQNLDGTFETLAVNHFDNNDPNAGQHMFIQMPNSSVAPPGMNGANECDLYNGGSSMGGANNFFFLPPASTSLSDSIQITRNEQPLQVTNGFSWLPGGILIQWGQVNFGGMITGNVNFNTDTNSVFSIVTTPFGALSGNSSIVIKVTSITTGTPGNFTYQITSPVATLASSFFWIAIGQ